MEERITYFHDMTSMQDFARLAQSVEHETLNLRVVGSSPTLGAQDKCLFFSKISFLSVKLKQYIYFKRDFTLLVN